MAIHLAAIGSTSDKSNIEAPSSIAYGVGVLCWLLSAGVYIAAKWISPEMPPWTLAFWRVLLAALILYPFVRHQFDPMWALVKTRGLELLFIGGLGLAICQGFMYVGLRHADAITAGIIMALMPLATMVIARVMLGERMTVLQGLGALSAFIGVLVIVARGEASTLLHLEFNQGELWMVASAIAFGFYTVLLKRANFQIERMPLLVLLLSAGAVTALPLYLAEELSGARSALTTSGVLALAYCAIPGGALMYYLFNWSIEALGASKASVLLYSQTIFVAILAYLILHERLHPFHLAGGAFIVVGIVLANLIRPQATPAQ
ncbi:EamA domain-containing membrane protein RarD [Kaistia soli DSM 19436]|uniref:EamA domain-containing membrane protein RarD n=1 Tax=Kaistia soli DSM 19436 TaxID=1122133 RepID=A0A1M5ECA8_9HYPH|nr:DMT family transporter [Kaistia soli]SHF76879.1 EamA domain-containing membrane protein RarD [Kaistia soli DSM 19436]